MMKSILTCERDLKETAVIEKRRRAEEERKRRFFNEKNRILGIDCDGLNRQLLEKEQKLEAERELSRIEAEEMRKNLELAAEREREFHDQKRKSEVELNEFRKVCQQPKDCADFDLNDPDGDKNALPARLDDNDPRLSISGGQQFIGEDLMNENRIREQKLLQKHWLDQQIAERKQLADSKKEADKQMSDSMHKHDVHAVFMSSRLNDDKRGLQRQIREYNESLAHQKRENDKKRREMEQQDNLAEIYNFLSSDLLKESQPKGSNLGPNRCIPYMYKGMTSEQIDQHKQEQMKQMNDMQLRKMEDQHQKEEWDKYNDEIHRKMSLKERALSRNIRQMNTNVREENEHMAKEQNYQKEQYEKVISTNTPTNEYFDQFNTSSR